MKNKGFWFHDSLPWGVTDPYRCHPRLVLLSLLVLVVLVFSPDALFKFERHVLDRWIKKNGNRPNHPMQHVQVVKVCCLFLIINKNRSAWEHISKIWKTITTITCKCSHKVSTSKICISYIIIQYIRIVYVCQYLYMQSLKVARKTKGGLWSHYLVNLDKNIWPIGSMYGIFTYIYHKDWPIVGYRCISHTWIIRLRYYSNM